MHMDQMLFTDFAFGPAVQQTGSVEHLAWASNSGPNQNTRIRDMCTASNRLPARGSCSQAKPKGMQQTKRMLETFASCWSQQVLFKDNTDAGCVAVPCILCAQQAAVVSPNGFLFLPCQRDLLLLFHFSFLLFL